MFGMRNGERDTAYSSDPVRAVVTGGSLGGLASAIALREAGCEVEVFERSQGELLGRGAGIVAQPELLRFLEEHGISTRDEISVPSNMRQYLAPDGGVARAEDSHQYMTSWGAVYQKLRAAFPEERYHQGSNLVGLKQDESGVIACFKDGREEECDLLVGADGTHSTCRRLLLPEVTPEYAGYVAWRGLVKESDLEPALARVFAEKFTFFLERNTQILCYLIPGPSGELGKGERWLNWVWYWNVPEGDELREVLTDTEGATHDDSVPQGRVREPLIQRQEIIAGEVLPDVFRCLFAQTAEPFIQVIQDLSVQRMAFVQVCLAGDAAFVPRPHTAASTSKATTNAAALAESLRRHGNDVAAALKFWEPAQLRLGRQLEEYGKSLGDSSQFGP
ncbi:MAG: 2-polyprenyl-6-methoxyphenol hydroxylase and related FAD-dependent oxidoreductases [uncultured Rubrobacteraceae bacterium]|uniref:2-polyprenyl-6-methoxyphenol hydroxylase and related FAD-dependent oxidoreductases n=1 Tax=uncultured Rubrobacteraceae bacterium TaxID=349277 RepID=A0A6J4QYY9_9ACTN|nr:MAG: 2-polyprenyl-6-methoxyphenol hydroxylase and related FAD-dependent oxidoreductases [uncultured Rubrobacteraceae bacterium]